MIRPTVVLWSFVRLAAQSTKGVYSRIKADGTKEYALVNKGTDSWGDGVNDVQQPPGYSDDMKDSINESSYFVANHKDSEITMVKWHQ